VKLVVVESKAKAVKIQGFLGGAYRVEPCMGHVRDLPNVSGSSMGIDVENGFIPTYTVSKSDIVTKLRGLSKKADMLYLATDPDREGEAIAWHLCEAIKPTVPVTRIVFGEITKTAIEEALANPRTIDFNLVQAQEARRLSDRLIGYILSPLLFKCGAVSGAKSVGRVQSPALRLMVEREYERRYFRSGGYWELLVKFKAGTVTLEAELLKVGDKRIASSKDFDADTGKLKEDAPVVLISEEHAQELVKTLAESSCTVKQIASREEQRKPAEPFRTVTLQQAAASQFSWTTDRTMRIAQRLYENGHITYTRTDSVSLSDEALEAARKIAARLGAEYVPNKPIIYQTSDAMAQEAHEAIRPAGVDWMAAEDKDLPDHERKLYELVYLRTVASQMTSTRLRRTSIDIVCEEATYRTRVTEVLFNGFRAIYEAGDGAEDASATEVPSVEEGAVLDFVAGGPKKHETQPPNRFSETMLIGRMEAEGVGRPSSYSNTISTLIRHGYIRRVSRSLVPTFLGMAVVRFLKAELARYVDMQYTSEMEDGLDRIARGGAERDALLADLHAHLEERSNAIIENISTTRVRELKFDDLDDKISLMIGRYGAYLVSDAYEKNRNIPDTLAPADLDTDLALTLLEAANGESYQLETGNKDEIWVKFGQHGGYLELTLESGVKQTASIPADVPAGEVTLELAESLLRPIAVAGNVEIYLRSGKGWYLAWTADGEKMTRSLPRSLDPMEMTSEQALYFYRMPHNLGAYPKIGGLIFLDWGRKGPYVRHELEGRKKHIVARIDMEDDWVEVTLEDAVEQLQPLIDRAAEAEAAKSEK
jgi:DNA topoisomerase-1